MLGLFQLNLKKQNVKLCFQKIFKERKPKYIWSDKNQHFLVKIC